MTFLPLRISTGFIPRLILITITATSHLLAQPASEPHEFYWVANGQINAMAETNGLLYIGGGFTELSPITGRFVPVEPATGKLAGAFPKIFGTVSAAVPDGTGGWFVGGDFVAVEDVPRLNIVHLRSDRSVDDAWVVNPNGRIASLALVGDRLFIGGEFTAVNFRPRVGLAELNPRTGQLQALNVGANGSVRSLASDGAKLFLGGEFSNVGGQARTNLAAIELSGNAIADWRVDCDATVTLLNYAGGRLFVGGDFSVIGSSNHQYVAALEAATGRVLPWDPDPSGAPSGLAVQGNRVFLAGGFLRVGGISRPALAAVDIDTGALLEWSPALQPSSVFGPGQLSAMALVDDTLYLGGNFYFGPPYMIAVNAETGEVKDWNPNPPQPVTLIAPGNGVLYTGGPFDTFGGVPRPYLAALDIATGRPTDWSPKFTDASAGVLDLALVGDVVFAAGEFQHINGEVRRALCAVRQSDASLLPFDANLIGFPAVVSRIGISSNHLFLGGSFNLPGVTGLIEFGAVDIRTGEKLNWDPAPTGTVRTFTVGGNRLFLSGRFSELAGQPRAGQGAYDIRTHTLTDWQPVTDAPVEKLVYGGGRLLLGGGFTKVNNQPRRFVASVDPITGNLHPWNLAPAQPLNPMVTVGTVFYSVQPSGTAFIGEGFATDYMGQPTEPWHPTFFIRGPSNFLVAGGKLFAAGGFATVNGLFRPTLAAFPMLNSPPEVTLTSPPDLIEVPLPIELELRAEATDVDGSVIGVEFIADDQVVGSASEPPYNVSWNPGTVGDHVLAAVAIDNTGSRSLSWSAHVKALPPIGDHPPTIAIASPPSGEIFLQGTDVEVVADAEDVDTKIARVEFQVGTNVVAVISNPPFAYAISNLAFGTYTLTARVVDEYGISTLSAPVNIRINSRPTVIRVGNQSGPFYVGTNLTVSFTATDRDGVIRFVRIVSGNTTVASNAAATASITLSNLAAGDYEFSAIAVDDLGGVGISIPYRFTVAFRPLNDFFAQRFTLPPMLGQAFATNTYASTEVFDPRMIAGVPPYHSLWWTWTPGFTGRAFVSTRGSSFYALLGVYSGSSLNSLTKLGSIFSPPGFHTNRVSLPVTAGSAYQIVVDSPTPSEAGSIVLNFGPEVVLRDVPVLLGSTLEYDGPTNVFYILQTWTNAASSWISTHTNRPGMEQRFHREMVPVGIEFDRLLLSTEVP